MRFEKGNPGGPGRYPILRRRTSTRLNDREIAAAKDGAVLLRLWATMGHEPIRYREAARAIERIVAQVEQRRATTRARKDGHR